MDSKGTHMDSKLLFDCHNMHSRVSCFLRKTTKKRSFVINDKPRDEPFRIPIRFSEPCCF